jgi:hypothetical protein
MKRLTSLSLAIVIASAIAGAGFAQGGGGVRQACAPDLAKLCPNAQAGADRRQCMMSHKDQLSDACKTAIAAMMARRQSGQTPNAPAN